MDFEPLWVGFSIFGFSRKRKVFGKKKYTTQLAIE